MSGPDEKSVSLLALVPESDRKGRTTNSIYGGKVLFQAA